MNNFTLELMLQNDRSFGPLLSLCQFTFIALIAMTSQLSWTNGRVELAKPTIPVWYHAMVATCFFATQILVWVMERGCT